MKHSLSVTSMALYAFLCSTSCKKSHNEIVTEKNCRLITMREMENVDPTQPNSGTVYLERNFIYEQNKLVRINSKKRGETDSYRTITYSGDLPVVETFFDKNNSIQYNYKFNYEPGTTSIGSIDIEYRNITPFVQARYVYHYDRQHRVDSIAAFYRGSFTEYILYEYPTLDGEKKVTATLIQRSDSDPNFKLKYAVIDYIYDDKKSPNYWPVFMWDQTHGETLNLITPNSPNNIESFTYKSINLSQSDPSHNYYVYDITYPSFNAAISYNENKYVEHYTENRKNLSSPVVYTYTYECN